MISRNIYFEENKFKRFGDYIEYHLLNEIAKKYGITNENGVEVNVFNVNRKGKKFKPFDIFVRNIKKRIEVKGDYMTVRLGNIIVETYGHDGFSGISTTKADYWVFVTGFYKIWITPNELKKYITLRNLSVGDVRGNGDNYTKKAYKVRHDDFIDYILNLNDKNIGLVVPIDRNSPLYWHKCIPFNYSLRKYHQEANIFEERKDELFKIKRSR
jgi:hypothetical protein